MFPDAISTALELVGLTRGSDESINLLMWLYRGAGLQDRMVADLQARAQNKDGDLSAALALAAIEQRQGHADAAMAMLGRYLHDKPGDMLILERVIALARQSDAVVPGFNALVAALHANPDNGVEVVRMLWDLFGQPPREESVAAVMKGRPADAESAEGDYLVGLLYAGIGDDHQSGRFLEKAIAERADFWMARTRRM